VSEYQYYEFQAIDRPLTKSEMDALRKLSTRATITPTRFVNVYNYGDFRGNPSALMEKYFDAHVYVANWGTHELMLRLPRRLLDPDVASLYCSGDNAAARAVGDFTILEFRSDDEEGGGIGAGIGAGVGISLDICHCFRREGARRNGTPSKGRLSKKLKTSWPKRGRL